MNRRALGRTRLTVSEVSLGAEHTSSVDERTNQEDLETAADSGIDLVDLIFESRGGCERLGRALRGLRDSFLLQGHLGPVFTEGAFRKSRDVPACRAWFDDLLRYLGADRVDILMLNWIDDQDDFDRASDPEGFLGLARSLRDQGKARWLGLSTHRVPIVLQAIERGLVDVLMFPVNPAHDLLPGSSTLGEMWSDEGYARLESGEWLLSSDRLELYQTCERRALACSP